jgi:hypothetical protein
MGAVFRLSALWSREYASAVSDREAEDDVWSIVHTTLSKKNGSSVETTITENEHFAGVAVAVAVEVQLHQSETFGVTNTTCRQDYWYGSCERIIYYRVSIAFPSRFFTTSRISGTGEN